MGVNVSVGWVPTCDVLKGVWVPSGDVLADSLRGHGDVSQHQSCHN